MDKHKITKETHQVSFELSDGSQIEGEVFLRLYEAHHSGRQRVGDLLNQSLSFIPVKTAEGPLLMNTSQIAAVKISLEVEQDDLMTLGKEYPIRIKMTHSKEMVGRVYVNLPEENCRVKDYFNQPLQFFPLFQSTSIVYINRDFILSVLG